MADRPKLYNVSSWILPEEPVITPYEQNRPPAPPPAKCATCGDEYPYTWDDDPPLPGEPADFVPQPGYYEIDSEWWGEKFHCSRRCYLNGEEYRLTVH